MHLTSHILRIPYTAHVTNEVRRRTCQSPRQPLFSPRRDGHVYSATLLEPDHHRIAQSRALRAAINRLPPDWQGRRDRPRRTCLRTIEARFPAMQSRPQLGVEASERRTVPSDVNLWRWLFYQGRWTRRSMPRTEPVATVSRIRVETIFILVFILYFVCALKRLCISSASVSSDFMALYKCCYYYYYYYFWGSTSTKPQAKILKLNNVNGCNDISFGDHSILEGDRIPPLKSHEQALEEELCFPQCPQSQPWCAGQSPASLLWLSHAMHLLSRWQTDRTK